ncbi:probable Ankyrin repeat and sterile alpha motif domain-containing protein at N-terminal half [Coccomyxa sp. Obi]|nr:probable Ankyrin repeat and sterile alpha motif domain-containing protein at N-terminal half [Coccomyxa sp. Obi]
MRAYGGRRTVVGKGEAVLPLDSAAAAGLRALEKRVESVPVAVYEFLQAGGVPAAVTIITSEPVAPELRDAAISLLSAVARKQPQAMSLAFTEAKGMAAVVHLLGRGIQPRGGALTEEGAATVAAAARLLEAALDAGGQATGGSFGAAGGFAALRTALACGQLSGQHATEVAERAVGLLHRLVWAGNKSFAGPQHAALCAAVCAARTHQPLLALIYTNSHVDAAVKGMEVLRALAAASNACMRALLQSNCIDTCLTVLDRADLNSNSNLRTALIAGLLLHDALDWDLACRGDILAKGGVSTFLNMLIRTPSEDAPIADVINSLLSALAEESDDFTHQDGKRPLHWAAQFGELEALEKILDGHPNMHAKDERGNTALHLAAAAGHMAAVKLLLDTGADVTARNFAGGLPHQLAVEGSPLWASLLAELDWRACLEQPRPCQYATTEGDASCSGSGEEWHGPAKCFFLALSGRIRIESADVPSPSSKHWFISAIKGHRSKASQPDQHPIQQPGQLLHEFKLPPHCDITALDDLTLSLDFRHEFTTATSSGHGGLTPEEEQAAGLARVGQGIERGVERKGGGRVKRLVIRVDSPPDQRAPDLAHALRSLLHRCYPASQSATAGLEAASGAAGTAEGHFLHHDESGVDSAPAMSPRSTLGHFLRSVDAIQAKRAGSLQLPEPQSQSDEQSCTAPSPSQPDFDGHELEAAARGKEAASSCPETERHTPDSVGETKGEVHSALPRESGLSEGGAGPTSPPPAAVKEPSQHQVSAQSAPAQRRPSSALEIARRLRRTPASKSGADLADAKAGNMSEAKLGADAGRGDSREPPSGSTSVGVKAISASSGLGVTADAEVDPQDGSASTSRLGPGIEQGAGKVQTEEDLAAGYVRQAVGDAHTSLQNEQSNRAADIPAAAVQGLPADGEQQREAQRLREQKQRPAMEGTAVVDAPMTSSNRAAGKALHTMSYLPLAENQRRSRKSKAPPPPPPPPPLLRNYGPAATVDPTATAAAVRAADEFRRQQQALGRGKLYAPTAQSVADKVRELELQIGLVQQLNSQGLRKEEVHAARLATKPEHSHISGRESAASPAEPHGALSTVGEGSPEPDRQGAGLQTESAAGEGTPGRQVTERRAESSSREGTTSASGRLGSADGAAAAAATTRSAAERTAADAAADALVAGKHLTASASSNAIGSTAVQSPVSAAGTKWRAESASREGTPLAADGPAAAAPTRSAAERTAADAAAIALVNRMNLSACNSSNAISSTAEESSVSRTDVSASTSSNGISSTAAEITASGAAEQVSRRKSARKSFYYGPRNTAPEQLQFSAVAAAACAHCEATPRREDAESEAELPKQGKPKRKPFAYGPRPSTLNAPKPEPAATAVEQLGRPAQASARLGEKLAAAGMTNDVASARMQSTSEMPAGVIFLDGGPGASLVGEDLAPAAIQRSPVRDSFTAEHKPSALRNDNTAADSLHSSADAAPLHGRRSTSVRKPFAYGPRKQAASENLAPNRGLSECEDGGADESGGALGVRQGWSADPRFIRG